MTNASTATLFSAGFVGSILLYQLLLNNWSKCSLSTNKRKPRKLELMRQRRKSLRAITDHIHVTQGGDNSAVNLMYSDAYFGAILQYLSTFEYLSTICRLSKYHYSFLRHNGANYTQNKQITYKMLLNESCLSWKQEQIASFFNKTQLLDIYNFMYHIANNWKFAGCSQTLPHNERHSELIQQMICLPHIVPNIVVVKHWFTYISHKLHIPIQTLCFRASVNDCTNKKKLKHFFVCSTRPDAQHELHLFVWIILYNLYQLYMQINMHAHTNGQSENQENPQSVMHSHYFGFQRELQKWLCHEHGFHFRDYSDMIALLKLCNMLLNTKKNEHSSHSQFNAIFILCIMMKVIVHNTELHIVHINKHKLFHKMKQIKEIFLENLMNIIAFSQYVMERQSPFAEMEKTENLKVFHSLLSNFKICAMIENILHWFWKSSKQRHKNRVFYLQKTNPLVPDISPVYFRLFGLNCRMYGQECDRIAVWI